MPKGNTTSSFWKDLPGLQPCLSQVHSASQWIRYHGEEKPVGVLIHGPTGSGKSYIKDKLVEELGYKGKDVLLLNASMFIGHPDKAWTHLFGYKKGAYTGATKDTKGALDEGYKAVVLDEFEMLPKDLQATLLVYLDTGSFTPLGDTKEKTSRTHLILLTNQSPEEHQAEGLYRDDLLYRLYSIRVPGLKERPQDVLVLAKHFLDDYKEKTGFEANLSVLEAAALLFHDWPGNARELRRVIWEKCTNGELSNNDVFVAHLKERYDLGFLFRLKAIMERAMQCPEMNQYSSLFPKNSIFEDLDWNKVDVGFWRNFLSKGTELTSDLLDGEAFLKDIEKRLTEGIDYCKIRSIKTPFEVTKQMATYWDKMIAEMQNSKTLKKEALAHGETPTMFGYKIISQIGNPHFLHLEPPPKETIDFISRSGLKFLKKHYDALTTHAKTIRRALENVFPHSGGSQAQAPPLLPSGEKETGPGRANPSFATIFLEQPWKKALEELEGAYCHYHSVIKGRKGKEAAKATGLTEEGFRKKRRKYGF